jgi:uncharacterized membrane protein YdjX (TVP38/TMEM64 family)
MPLLAHRSQAGLFREGGRVKRQTSIAWTIAASTAFVAVLLGTLFLFDAHKHVLSLLTWIEAKGAWGPLLFIALMALVVVLVLPGVLFTTGAGFVFGVAAGSLYVVVGTTIGAAVSFLIARHLFSRRVARFVLRRARLRLVSEELARHGWKIVLLTRLVPFFPFKLSNYFFGLTRFSLRGFVGGTLLGIIPFSVHNAYLGSLAADVATVGQRHGEWSAVQWAIYGLGFVATLVSVLYLNRLARRALAKYGQ